MNDNKEKEQHFRVPKGFLTSELFTKPTELRLFLFLIGNARYKDGVHGGNIVLKQGQFIRSLRKLQDDLAHEGGTPNRTTVVKAIKYLEELNLIRTEKSQAGTIFSITNFKRYQGKVVFEEDHSKENVVLDENHSGLDSVPPSGLGERPILIKENITNKDNNLYNLSSNKNKKRVDSDDRDSSTFEWEKYNFKF
jgi:hypothetical protein